MAVNASGSFPALVIASLAAVESVKAKPLLITSLGASSWGANRPEFTWAHMEKSLRKIHPAWKSIAMSLGGDGDAGEGLSTEGRRMLLDALAQSGVPVLAPATDADIAASRMRLWKERNSGQLPDLLINIGGNQAFWGTGGRDAPAAEGLLFPGTGGPYGDGVGKLFTEAGKPVIHLLGIKKIAARYGIAVPPDTASPLWRTSQPSFAARLLSIALLLVAMLALPRLI